jgi:Outer membrane receptor for ferrienterochelin and colicins
MRKGILTFLFAIVYILELFAQADSLNVYDMNLSQLAEIKISSASKIVQNIKEVPSSVFVITGQQIKENAYTTLEDALSDLPGFQFRNIQGINSYVFQRGVPNQNNLSLVLIDGVQINELNSGGFYGGGQYNLTNVDRIEIVYGPSSVAYGTNAMTGVINIITKNPLKQENTFHTSVGSFNTLSNDFLFSYANKEQTLGVSFSGLTKKTDKGNLKGGAGDNNWTDLMDNYEKDYSYDLKVLAKDFVIGMNYQNKQTSTATLFKTVGTDYKDYGTLWNIRFINNYVRYQKKLSDTFGFSSTLYNRNATVLPNTVYYVLDSVQVGYYRPNNLTGLEAIFNYTSGKIFSLTSGLTFEHEWLAKSNTLSFSASADQRPPRPDKPQIVQNNLTSFFLEPRLTLVHNLYVSGGFRYDMSSIYDQKLTPRVGLIYQLSKHLVRLSYAEAFRAPKAWDYTDGLGNTSLNPEEMKSLEAAFVFSFWEKMQINLTGYSNHLNNVLTKEFLPNGYRWTNSGEINTHGLEFLARFSEGRFYSSMSYTYNHSMDEAGHSMPEISRSTGNAFVAYSFSKKLKVNMRSYYVSKRQNLKLISSTQSMYVDPYLTLSGTVSLLDINGFDVQLSGRNLLNKEYYHTSNRDPDRYRQPQRLLMITLGYTFKTNE